MTIEIIEPEFSICQVQDYFDVDPDREFCFPQKTDEENSLVCLTWDVPENTLARDDHWRAFRVRGPLDLSLIGILARISAVLSEADIGMFAISTYNTDYIFVKRQNYERAVSALAAAGYELK